MTRLPALGPRGEGWVAIQLVLLAGIGLAGLAGPAWSGDARLVTLAIGSGIGLAGFVLAIAGIVQLREAITPFPYPTANARLLDGGAYRLVRHPIYAGIVAMAAGYGLVTASPLVLGLALVLLGFFGLKSAREETWLSARFPEYGAYRRRTRRLVPWLW